MKKSYKVKLNIKSEHLKSLFKKMSGLYRKIYNTALDFQYYRYIANRKNRYVSYNTLRKAIDYCKEEQFPYLQSVDGGIYYAAIATATNAFRYAFKYNVDTIPFLSRKKDIMKFKTKGNVRVYNDYLVIPKIGKVKLQEKSRIPLNRKYYNITFTNEGDGWFVSLEVDEDYQQPKLTGAPIFIDFTNDGNIKINEHVIESSVKTQKYIKTQRKLKKLAKKLKRQTTQNLKEVSPTRSIPVTTRNMIKTRQKLDINKKILYNIRNDIFKKLVCDVARTKPREVHILCKSSVRRTRNGYLTRKMREADCKRLLNMMRKKMELIGANINLISNSKSPGYGEYICGGYCEYHSSAKADPTKQTSVITE